MGCVSPGVFCPFRMALGKSWNFDLLKFGFRVPTKNPNWYLGLKFGLKFGSKKKSGVFIDSYSQHMYAYVHRHWFSPDEGGVCTSCARLQVHWLRHTQQWVNRFIDVLVPNPICQCCSSSTMMTTKTFFGKKHFLGTSSKTPKRVEKAGELRHLLLAPDFKEFKSTVKNPSKYLRLPHSLLPWSWQWRLFFCWHVSVGAWGFSVSDPVGANKSCKMCLKMS